MEKINQKSKTYKKFDLKRGVDFIGVNCVFFCHDGNNRFLLSKRSQNCRDEQGNWDSGGGSMEFGEDFEETVKREVLEEYGVEPLEIQYIATENILRDNNGNKTHWIRNLHLVLVGPKKAKNNEPEKIDEIGWFAFNELPDPLHSQMSTAIDEIKKHLKLVFK